jgi:hypothetical protein
MKTLSRAFMPPGNYSGSSGDTERVAAEARAAREREELDARRRSEEEARKRGQRGIRQLFSSAGGLAGFDEKTTLGG